jgi:enoyl-CoA hydratase
LTSEAASTTGDVSYEVVDHVANVTINRPERRNSLNLATSRRLIEIFSAAADDSDVWVIVLTGTGSKAFSAGADIKELDEIARAGGQVPTPMMGDYRNIFEVILETYKPTIASLNGPAVAGGCELALACDLRIAAEHAYLAMPEAKIGMGANFASVLLPRLLPRAVALEMLYTGNPLPPDQALRWGLYNRLVSAESLAEETRALARSIAVNAPLTLRRYKEMTVKGWDLPVPTALRLNVGPNAYASRDRQEGIEARLQKRPPRWEAR